MDLAITGGGGGGGGVPGSSDWPSLETEAEAMTLHLHFAVRM